MVILPGGIVVYECADWGARTPRNVAGATVPTNIVLHHMAYPNREPIADHAKAVIAAFYLARRCQSDHMDNRGWADTGQHFTVSIDGIICEGRHGSVAAVLAGHCIRGAHAADAGVDDNNSWGTEHEGTFTVVHMQPAQWYASVRLQVAIAHLCNLDTALIIGHRDTGCNTDCPGDWFHSVLPQFRDEAHTMKAALEAAGLHLAASGT